MNANNSDISGVLQRVLGDPDSMQKVLKLVGSFKNNNKEKVYEDEIYDPDDEEISEEIGESEEFAGPEDKDSKNRRESKESREAEENRIKLLCALQPYLNEERRSKADIMIRILKLLRFTDLNELTNLLGGILK